VLGSLRTRRTLSFSRETFKLPDLLVLVVVDSSSFDVIYEFMLSIIAFSTLGLGGVSKACSVRKHSEETDSTPTSQSARAGSYGSEC